MAKYITEDDIEIAVLDKLSHPDFDYDIIKCDPDPSKREDLNDGTGRSSKKECVLPCILKESLMKINPHIPEGIIDDVAKIRPVGMSDHVETEFGIRPTEIFGFESEFSDRPFLKLSHVLEHCALRLEKGGVHLDFRRYVS